MARKKSLLRTSTILELSADKLENTQGGGGLEIRVPGFQANPTDPIDSPCQIFLEYYEGKLQVHVWNGTSEDPQTIVFPRQ